MTEPFTLDPFRPGAVVGGKYVVERKLAEGGIGIVVVATHIQLGHKVAIKYLQSKVLQVPVLVERFKREAKLAASIRSDHVVRVFDVGILDDGAPYMVMEYLEGEDLGAVVRRGPLAAGVAVDYVLQACEALAEAHSLGIVHRDLKPENLFLAQRGGGSPVVKILDFGISKAGGGSEGLGLPRVTEQTDRFGTPIYMSPEQLTSSTNVDARADIWALGVVLFELLTASTPFEGDTLPQIATAIQLSPAKPLRRVFPMADFVLEAAILRCLEKDPAQRYRNIAELAIDLAAFGVPASQERIANIERIVRGGGDSVRPSLHSGALRKPRQSAVPTLVGTATGAIGASPARRPILSRGAGAAVVILLGLTVTAGGVYVAGSARVRMARSEMPIPSMRAPDPSHEYSASAAAAAPTAAALAGDASRLHAATGDAGRPSASAQHDHVGAAPARSTIGAPRGRLLPAAPSGAPSSAPSPSVTPPESKPEVRPEAKPTTTHPSLPGAPIKPPRPIEHIDPLAE